MSKFCRECGNEIHEKAVICPKCGCKIKCELNTDKNKWIALILWFFLGAFGGHRFYVGDTGTGIAYVLCTLFGWILLGIPYIIEVILLVVDLVSILHGELGEVELEG